MNTFVIIPALNEEKRIAGVLTSAKKYSQNIVVVDDGSKDKTIEVAIKSGVIILRHKINLGKGAALKTGCDFAFNNGAEMVITIDSDGQHNPDKIPLFVQAIEEGNDIAFGVRSLKSGTPLTRKLGNEFACKLIKYSFGIELPDILCGFRAFTKYAYERGLWNSAGYGVETEMVAKTGLMKLKYKTVPIETIYIDKYKGVSLIDALKIIVSVVSWKLYK